MFIEIAYGLLGLALVVLVIYLIILFSKIGKVVDETQVTIKTLTSDVNVTLHQTNELLAKVNVLTEDLNQKVATIDPLFTAVADLSVSVSDLNDQARQISKKAVVVGGKTVKTSVGLKPYGTFIIIINWNDHWRIRSLLPDNQKRERVDW